MKATNKANAGSKRRRKRVGQVRPRVQQQATKQGPGSLVKEVKDRQRDPTQMPHSAEQKTPPDGLERIRKMWEYKQEELETRWATAQAHQAEQRTRRKRAIKIGSSIAGAALALLLCIAAWIAA